MKVEIITPSAKVCSVIALGSLHNNGSVYRPGFLYDKGFLKIGDKGSGPSLFWVDTGDLLVADRCICVNISWNQLNEMGYIKGRILWIDGKPYYCRCMKLGTDPDQNNEWRHVLNRTTEDNNLWHWEDAMSVGQECFLSDDIYQKQVCPAMGYVKAQWWTSLGPDYRSIHAGFRPVLEPLSQKVQISQELIGDQISVRLPEGYVTGTLTGFSGYDLFLVAENMDEAVPRQGCMEVDNKIVIDRSQIRHIVSRPKGGT